MNVSTTRSRDTFSGDAILYYSICGSLAVVGVATNTLNTHIFQKTRSSDCLTLCFLALSVVDMVYCLTILIFVVFELSNLTVSPTAEPLREFVVFIGSTAYTTSPLLTTFLVLQKCCLLALPFYFKSAFPKRRVVNLLVGIVVFSVLSNIALLLPLIQRVSTLDSIKLIQVLSIMTNTLNYMIIPVTIQGLVFGCFVILVNKFRQTVRFRVMSTATKSPAARNSKEANVIKGVTLVAVNFLLTNVHKVIFILLYFIYPDLDTNASFNLANRIMYGASFGAFAVLNTCVYLTTNLSYRRIVGRILQGRSS